jgi:ketosteroid isomerase-like protein
MQASGASSQPGVESRPGAIDGNATVRAYLAALTNHDIPRCLDLFTDDATVKLFTAFKGKRAIEKFHRERFAADLRVVRVDAIQANGNTVLVDCAVATKKLAAARISALPGRATFQLEGGKIRSLGFGLLRSGG